MTALALMTALAALVLRRSHERRARVESSRIGEYSSTSSFLLKSFKLDRWSRRTSIHRSRNCTRSAFPSAVRPSAR